MSKAKTDPKRKGKLENFKQSQKSKTQSMSEQTTPQLPELRQVPIWSAKETIEMNGVEFQAIYEAIATIQQTAMVLQNIVTRNIMNEKIRLDFEKLDPQTNSYVQMTEEEKAPHAEQVRLILNTLREKANPAKEEAKVVTLQA